MTDNTYLGQYAGFGSRAAAFLIDFLVIYLIQVIVSWFTINILLFFGFDLSSCPTITSSTDFVAIGCQGFGLLLLFFNLTFPFFYFAFFWLLTGQTIGKYILGIRLVRMDGKRMNIRRSLLRYAGYFLALAPLTLGFLWIFGDDRRQGWHDKLARTCVVYAWPGGHSGRILSKLSQWVDHRFRLKPPEAGLSPEDR